MTWGFRPNVMGPAIPAETEIILCYCGTTNSVRGLLKGTGRDWLCRCCGKAIAHDTFDGPHIGEGCKVAA